MKVTEGPFDVGTQRSGMYVVLAGAEQSVVSREFYFRSEAVRLANKLNAIVKEATE